MKEDAAYEEAYEAAYEAYDYARMIDTCQFCGDRTIFDSKLLYGVDLCMRDRKNFMFTGELGSFMHNKYNRNFYICMNCAKKINDFIDTLKEEQNAETVQ